MEMDNAIQFEQKKNLRLVVLQVLHHPLHRRIRLHLNSK